MTLPVNLDPDHLAHVLLHETASRDDDLDAVMVLKSYSKLVRGYEDDADACRALVELRDADRRERAKRTSIREQVGHLEGLTLKQIAHEAIRQALVTFRGNRKKTAEALGIGERTLYRKIDEMEEAGS